MKTAAARRKAVLHHIESNVTDTEGLALLCGVSISTIRRDLAQLSEQGVLLRTYGGAAPITQTAPEQPYDKRVHDRSTQKQSIARVGAKLVLEDETIILDAGTTVRALAMELRERRSLHVVTNSWTVVQAVGDREGIEMTMLGGHWRPISMAFVGPHAERTLRRISAKRVFLGADGVVAGRGVCEMTPDQAALKELMIDQAAEIYVLATSDKLGNAASSSWIPLNRPWTLITDDDAEESLLDPFRRLGKVTIKREGIHE